MSREWMVKFLLFDNFQVVYQADFKGCYTYGWTVDLENNLKIFLFRDRQNIAFLASDYFLYLLLGPRKFHQIYFGPVTDSDFDNYVLIHQNYVKILQIQSLYGLYYNTNLPQYGLWSTDHFAGFSRTYLSEILLSFLFKIKMI